jgi:hypothetical protein
MRDQNSGQRGVGPATAIRPLAPLPALSAPAAQAELECGTPASSVRIEACFPNAGLTSDQVLPDRRQIWVDSLLTA